MQKFKTFLTVIGAVTILVLAANSAVYAATGGKLILGHTNKAGKISTLKRTTNGSALKLVTKSSSNAPLIVNGTGEVTNLNADQVDGLDAASLRNQSSVFTKAITVPTTFFSVAVPVPPGTYTFGYSALLDDVIPASPVFCRVARVRPATTTYVAVSQFNAGSSSPGITGAGAVTRASGDTIDFECGSSTAFTTLTDIPIQIVMTPTIVTGAGSLRTTARSGARIDRR